MTIDNARDILVREMPNAKDKNLRNAMYTAARALIYLGGEPVTCSMLESMRLLMEWYERDRYCRERDEQGVRGCTGCPYDLGDTCDSASTESVVRECATTFKKYFDAAEKIK